tara:strand:- start:258 stop:527 length:270 start_codon:yes stop_codon:yes gene_type:complete
MWYNGTMIETDTTKNTMTKAERKKATAALIYYVNVREADSNLYGATIMPAAKSAAFYHNIKYSAMDLPFKTVAELNREFPELDYKAGIS